MFRIVLGLILLNGVVLRVLGLYPPPPSTGLLSLGLRVIEATVKFNNGHVYKFSYYWLLRHVFIILEVGSNRVPFYLVATQGLRT